MMTKLINSWWRLLCSVGVAPGPHKRDNKHYHVLVHATAATAAATTPVAYSPYVRHCSRHHRRTARW